MLDERARYYRRLRRLRGSGRRWTVLAGGLTGGTAVLVPHQGIGALDAIWAGLAGAAVVLA
ncbi:MAG: phage shock envelope stress response protein PspM, partial [Natronosporangium sp.]